MILSNIDFPQDLAKGLNEAQERAVKYLHSQIVNLDLNLKNLQSDVKQLKKSDSSESVASMVSNLIKSSENKFETQLSSQKEKILSKFNMFESAFQDFKEKALSQFHQSKISKEDKLDIYYDLKSTLKSEIIDLNIRPLEFELKENYKAIHLLEKTVNIQAWNVESTHKELNSRFEMHKENFIRIEKRLEEFIFRANDLIQQITLPIKNEFEKSEQGVKELWVKFGNESDRIINELRCADDKRVNLFNSHFLELTQRGNELEKMMKNLQITRNLYLQEMNTTLGKINSDFETFKSETRLSNSNAHERITRDVLNSYKQEIKVLHDKLKWLPADSENLSDMTQLEARLYTIETRIRAEELNRINQFNDLFQSN